MVKNYHTWGYNSRGGPKQMKPLFLITKFKFNIIDAFLTKLFFTDSI